MPINFGFDNPFMKAWMLLHQTHNLISRCEDEVFAKYGITTEQHAVLMAIKYIEDPVKPTEVAKWLDRNPNSISLIVDRMIKAKLVERIRDLQDRRSVRLVITNHGKDILDRATVPGWELIREILSPLSADDLPALTRLLETVRNKSFERLNPDNTIESIKMNETKNMASFMKRVAEYGSDSAFSAQKKPPAGQS